MVERVGLDRLKSFILEHFAPPELTREFPIIIYGEWCGQGVQRGVAISQLPKMWVIFAARQGREEETRWLDLKHHRNAELPELGVYNINRFAEYELEIDFETPDRARLELSTITERVEQSCPVARVLKVEGTGEGVVWRCLDPEYVESRFWFKVKGDKHSATRVRKIAAVDPERLASLEAFLKAVLSERRLEQGLEHLEEQGKPLSKLSTGSFLSWIFADILTEEADTMAASSLSRKEIGAPVAKHARRWFFERVKVAEES